MAKGSSTVKFARGESDQSARSTSEVNESARSTSEVRRWGSRARRRAPSVSPLSSILPEIFHLLPNQGPRYGKPVPRSFYTNEFQTSRQNICTLAFWSRALSASEMIPAILQAPLRWILPCGLLANATVILVFAGLMYATPYECLYFYNDPSDRDPSTHGNATHPEFGSQEYLRIIWFSMHSFTTIGYGSAFPTCASTEILVFLEHYTATVLQGAFIAIFLFKFLMPRPLVRFSAKALISGTPSVLSLRLVRESSYQLSDCAIELRGRLILDDLHEGSGVVIEREGENPNLNAKTVNLAVTSSTLETLDVWEVVHEISAGSPLYDQLARDGTLDERLIEINVALSVFDTAYSQEVKLHTSYHREDIVVGAKFEPMVRAAPVSAERGSMATRAMARFRVSDSDPDAGRDAAAGGNADALSPVRSPTDQPHEGSRKKGSAPKTKIQIQVGKLDHYEISPASMSPLRRASRVSTLVAAIRRRRTRARDSSERTEPSAVTNASSAPAIADFETPDEPERHATNEESAPAGEAPHEEDRARSQRRRRPPEVVSVESAAPTVVRVYDTPGREDAV